MCRGYNKFIGNTHEKILEKNRRWRERNREKLREAKKASYAANAENWRTLHIDHVNGNGHKERQALKSRWAYSRKILHDTEGLYQILCANCNNIKRLEDLGYIS